jgi:signal transduction histidine kinase/ActR/RegA family two-component response regulator
VLAIADPAPGTHGDLSTWLVGAMMFALLLALQWASAQLYRGTLAREREASRRLRDLFEQAPIALAAYDVTGAHDWLAERGLLGRADEVRRLAAEEPAAHEPGLERILIRDVNPAAVAAGARAPGDGPTQLRPENLRAGVYMLEAIAAGGGAVQRELELLLDGARRRVIASIVVPPGRAGLEHVVGGFVDITMRRALEEAAGEAQRLETVGLLAGGIAHDFNNVLTVLRMGVERVGRALPETAPARRDVERMRDAVTRATARTRQLLLFGRRQLARPVVFGANRALAELEPLLRRTIDARIAIELVLDDDAGTVALDPSLLEQAILALVLNAQDAMPDGGRLTLHTRRRGDDVQIEVTDTGRGMSAAQRARAFEPFYSTKPSARGAGLGLSIVHGIVTQAGGAVTIDSEPGRGTTVTLTLHRAGDAAIEAAAAAAPARTSSERVLLVEDEDGVREVAQASLEEAGYRVVAVRSGAEALAAVAGGASVDLVVSDLVMPGIGGRELAGQLRRGRPELPIVFVSGFAPDGDPTAALDGGGATTFLAKPFTCDQLLASVRAVLPEAS